jgi:hypothetical protein
MEEVRDGQSAGDVGSGQRGQLIGPQGDSSNCSPDVSVPVLWSASALTSPPSLWQIALWTKCASLTRPGIAPIVAASAVELLVSLIQHPGGYGWMVSDIRSQETDFSFA